MSKTVYRRRVGPRPKEMAKKAYRAILRELPLVLVAGTPKRRTWPKPPQRRKPPAGHPVQGGLPSLGKRQ